MDQQEFLATDLSRSPSFLGSSRLWMKTVFTRTSLSKVFTGCMVHIMFKEKQFEKCGVYPNINMIESVITSMQRIPGEAKKVRILKISQPRTFNAIIKLIGSGDIYSFHQILDHLNSTMRNGCSSQRLSNILSKYPDFIEEDSVMGGNSAHDYRITTWRYVAWE